MISVILPVYNVERYLGKCVCSLLSQDYQDIEIILVNDSSTDDSLAVCNDFAARDARVRVVNKHVNEGVDAARVTGFRSVSPESRYAMFVDSDDWLSPGILSRCVRVAEEHDADFVQMGMRRVFDRFGLIRRESPSNGGDRVTDLTPDMFDELYVSFFGVNIVPVNLCGKLYRTDFLRRHFPGASGLTWGEDLVMNMKMFPFVRKFVTIDDIGYNYRVGGMTSRYQSSLLRQSMEMFLLKEQAMRDYNYDKGTFWARVEMKNILKTSVEQSIAYGVETGRDMIAGLLADPMWNRISEIADDSRCASDPFVRAMAARDVDALFDYCATYKRPNGILFILRTFVQKLVN